MKKKLITQAFKILFHRGHHSDDDLNLRRWFVFFLIYMTALAVTALMNLNDYNSQGSRASFFAGLLMLYIFYLSLSCTFFPAPTAWLVLLMASPIINLSFISTENSFLSGLATVLIIALLGAWGSAIANLNEYHVFTFLLRFGQTRGLRHNRIYTTAVRWFEINPFMLILLMNFLPIPVDVVRWLAITHRYRRDYFFWSSFLGRFIRYSLLAATARSFQIGWLGIALIQAALIALVVLRYLPGITTRLNNNPPAEKPAPVEKVISA
ncbi:MAG: hypothetical protein JW860_02905 [Sedimentisphaerales bacterium]|nr:hypothetical protein [Sedimentisphaerales bacterium]